jgi:hypothetical protein
MSRRNRLVWADKVALLLALLVVGVMFVCWIVGIIGLEGRPHLRFDSAMFDGAVKAEWMVVLPIWVFLRVMDFGAKALVRWLRSSLGRVRSGGLRLPSYSGVARFGAQAGDEA